MSIVDSLRTPRSAASSEVETLERMEQSGVLGFSMVQCRMKRRRKAAAPSRRAVVGPMMSLWSLERSIGAEAAAGVPYDQTEAPPCLIGGTCSSRQIEWIFGDTWRTGATSKSHRSSRFFVAAKVPRYLPTRHEASKLRMHGYR